VKTSVLVQKIVAYAGAGPACEAEHPSQISSPSRRKLFGKIGGVTAAAWTAGAIGVSPFLGSESTRAHADTTYGRTRAVQAYTIRRNAAEAEWDLPLVDHPHNGDEQLYSNRIGNYSKALPHNSLGEVDPAAYNLYLNAIRSGEPTDFENIPLGGNTRLTDPQSGLAFGLEGTDSGNLAEPPSPSVSGQERAAEAVENYWMALLRDVAFTNYTTDSTVAQACAELTKLSGFKGPRIHGTVTPQTLFRGFTAGDLVGPYISQFLLQTVYFGALPIAQRYATYLPAVDYMIDFGSWLAVENGQGPFGANVFDLQLRYLRDGRGVSAFVHVDLLYQAYFMGMLWLLRNAAYNVGNPYNTSRTQTGFGTFGSPHINVLMTEVSAYALRAQWFQKWWVHRALRPEAFGGLVHNTKTAAVRYPLHGDVLNSHALAEVFERTGTYLLPIAFPEGSPTHPSYGSGHATVAGACVTVLKAFFNTDNVVFPNPVVPTTDGLSLEPYTGGDAGQITLTGELNKLASNIAQARNIAGVHWRSDATQAMLLGEAMAISVLRDQRRCYNESFAGFTFTKLDGTRVTI
jgi:membrane-associated phospholipid phosphatase